MIIDTIESPSRIVEIIKFRCFVSKTKVRKEQTYHNVTIAVSEVLPQSIHSSLSKWNFKFVSHVCAEAMYSGLRFVVKVPPHPGIEHLLFLVCTGVRVPQYISLSFVKCKGLKGLKIDKPFAVFSNIFLQFF